MPTKPPPALLPAGLRDLLPPDAKLEADLVHRMISIADANGFTLVKAPLAEFEDGLLANAGKSLARQIFRFMDPQSQEMLAVRADITPQIARIAATRLIHAPRPLKLAYSGEVLRVSGTVLRPERQFCQMGCELIGADDLAADLEIILLAFKCLSAIGLNEISVDLNLPTLVPALLGEHSTDALLEAISRRDIAALRQHGGPMAPSLEQLILSAGLAADAGAAIARIDLPPPAASSVQRLLEVAARLKEEAPTLVVTIDPVERRGFEYQSGVSFTFFSRDHGEIGRGGRYNTAGETGGEAAVGFTFMLDRLLAALGNHKGEQ